MKDEFLSTLSDELRTPLNAILGWANILRSSPTNDPVDLQQGLETIERNARSQAQLIEELLDMSRIINGKLRLDVQPVDLQAVICDAIESVRPAAEAKGIRLTKVLDPRAGPITGDPNRIQQVLWNLFSNAIKFTGRGGRVQVFLHRVNSHVEISVTDSGQGIPADFLPQLFTRFSQAETSAARRHGGLGTGDWHWSNRLSNCTRGTVKASSLGVDRGASFTVSLPLTVVHEDKADDVFIPAPSTAANMSPPDLSGFHILVIDDEPDARILIQRVLARCNATVTTAASAAEGLAAVRKHHPDMIFSDIGMPEEDGYGFLTKLPPSFRCRRWRYSGCRPYRFCALRRSPPGPDGRLSDAPPQAR